MSRRPPRKVSARRGGFTIVEVIVAVIVLAIGVVSMASTTIYVIRQVTLADLTTKRSFALQQTLESLRATGYDNLAAGSDSVGVFQVDWTVSVDSRSTEVTVITTGPGLTSVEGYPMLAGGVADTFTYRVIRP